MTDKPPEPDKLDDTEAERRFNETLGRMLAMPPKPHASAGGAGDKGKRRQKRLDNN